jgi:murein DD-endopeptidase MepM/ murein hydrolase activator NlpD
MTNLRAKLRQLVFVSVAASLFVTYSAQPAFAAVTVNDIDSIINQHWYYSLIDECEPGANSSPAAGVNAAIITGDNAKDTYIFLTGNGLPAAAAAGLMGNLAVESGFRPDINEIGKGPHWGFGIAQWTDNFDRNGNWLGGGRRTTLENAGTAEAAAKGVDPASVINSLDFQLRYLMQEAQGRQSIRPPGSNDWDGMKQFNDPNVGLGGAIGPDAGLIGAVLYWENNFERSVDTNADPATNAGLKARLGAAKEIFGRYGSGGGATPSNAGANAAGGCPTAQPGGGTGTGSFRLPIDRSFFDAHPNWLTDPHHAPSAGKPPNPASDIPVGEGTPIYSMTDGVVLLAPNEGGYGKGVTIDAGKGVIIAYGHGLDGGSIVRVGDKVAAGDLIMHADNTGDSQGHHLHLDIRINGVGHCPQELFVAIYENRVPADFDFNSLPTSGCVKGS